MPEIVQDAGILAAARDAIDILLQFKGTTITLIPSEGTKIPKPGGGHDFADPVPREPQLFALSQTGVFDGIEFSPNDDGKNQKRAYVLTGRYDADIQRGDTWEDDEATYEVDTLNNTNGFKSQATVTGWLKVP